MSALVMSALALGLSAGISPGPLMALVLAETAQGGWRRGTVAAMAPLASDGLVITLALFALRQVPEPLLATLEALGGALLLYLGAGMWRSAAAVAAAAPAGASPTPAAAERRGQGPVRPVAFWRTLARGTLVNLLNPNPWLFWLTAGGSLVRQALAAGSGHLVAFLVAFFGTLVGAKVAVAFLAGCALVGGRWHGVLLKLSGVALLGLGVRSLWYVAERLVGPGG